MAIGGMAGIIGRNAKRSIRRWIRMALARMAWDKLKKMPMAGIKVSILVSCKTL